MAETGPIPFWVQAVILSLTNFKIVMEADLYLPLFFPYVRVWK